MLVLYETALGFCLFKVSDSAKLESANLWKEFESPEQANKLYVCSEFLEEDFDLRHLRSLFNQPQTASITSVYIHCNCCRRHYCPPRRETWKGVEAISDGWGCQQGEGEGVARSCGPESWCASSPCSVFIICLSLVLLLYRTFNFKKTKHQCFSTVRGVDRTLAWHSKSACRITEWPWPQRSGYNESRSFPLFITVSCSNESVWLLLLTQLRFKLKFSPDKVDTMVVQAIALLDDLDKEINIYAMRVKVCAGLPFLTSPSSPIT